MAETLKDVIERLKQQKNVQQTVAKPQSKQEVPPSTEEDLEFDEGSEESLRETEGIPQVSIEERKMAERIAMEIEMLQNNGRFRAELLHQLNEINQVLIVIAGALADLSKNGK